MLLLYDKTNFFVRQSLACYFLEYETYSRKRKISSITGISNFNCHTQQHNNPLIISLLKKRKTRLFQLFQLFQLILKHIHPLSLIYIIYIIN